MAQKVSVQLLCDLHDKQDVEAAETAVFAIDGATYEIELCQDHGRQFREAGEPVVAAARRSGGPSTRPRTASGRSSRTARPSSPATASAGGQSAVREWARSHGYTLSDRGRLSAEVTAAYNAAH